MFMFWFLLKLMGTNQFFSKKISAAIAPFAPTLTGTLFDWNPKN